MTFRKLGTTQIEVSSVAMGCWSIAGGAYWGTQSDAQGIRTIHAALDAGINFFDTAEGYGAGHSEELLGQALAGRRDQAVIASKLSSGHLAPVDVAAACEASLRRLGTDYLDVYQIHWPRHDVPISGTLTQLSKLRDAGKIRAIGVSNFGVRDLSDALAIARVEVDQLPYSLVWRAVEAGIQSQCISETVSILAYSPLAQGLLTDTYASADEVPAGRAGTRFFSYARGHARHGEPGFEDGVFTAIAGIREIAAELGVTTAALALAWVLHRPGVASVLAGARNPDQVVAGVAAAGLSLPPDTIAALETVTDPVRKHFGANPDMWQPDATSRYR